MPEATSTSLRGRLLAEAIGLLDKGGPTSFTVRAVAAAADCSTIGVYTHFDGKQGLLDAVIVDSFESFDSAVSKIDTIPGGVDRLLAGALAYRDWALTNTTRYRLMFASLVPEFVPRPAAIARAELSFIAHRSRVEHAVTRDELMDVDPDRLARHLWACVHGHVMLELSMGIRLDDQDARAGFGVAARWMLDGVRPPRHSA